MSKHSSIIGGSTATRLLNCPGSYQAIMALPPAVDVPSEYAEEGTAMHAVMERLMHNREFPASRKPEYWLGQKFHDRKLTQTHIDEMIQPALDELKELEALYQDGFSVAAVEASVRFPNVPGGFGTCDLILESDRWVLHIDWKFGAGIPVKAVVADEHGERVNAQLLFYATAAFATLPKLYRNKKALAVAIIQPRGEPALSHTAVSRQELKWFREDVEGAIDKALDYNPPRRKGEHCRFAPCKVNCPEWTKPLLDLSRLGVVTARPEDVNARKATEFGNYLAHAKALVDIVSVYKKNLDEQMHAFLEAGGVIPGWRLKPKAKMRQWVDPEIVVPALEALGLTEDEIWQRKLQTFQVADAAARRHGATIPENLRVAPPTTETTLATTDDPAPVVDRSKAIDNFRAAMLQLRHLSNS